MTTKQFFDHIVSVAPEFIDDKAVLATLRGMKRVFDTIDEMEWVDTKQEHVIEMIMDVGSYLVWSVDLGYDQFFTAVYHSLKAAYLQGISDALKGNYTRKEEMADGRTKAKGGQRR